MIEPTTFLILSAVIFIITGLTKIFLRRKFGFKNRNDLIKILLMNITFALPIAYCIIDFFVNTKFLFIYLGIIVLSILFESIFYTAVFKGSSKKLSTAALSMDLISIGILLLCSFVVFICFLIIFVLTPHSLCC